MKRVVSVVLNSFTNDSRVLKEAISLQKAGYKVEVIALWEDGLEEHEIIENISVHRIKLKSRNWSKNRLIQILKYIEFLYRVIIKYRDIDIIHCNDLGTLPIGVLIKKFSKKDVKIVYDAHEYETEINGLKGMRKGISKILEKSLIKKVDKTITVSDTIAKEYVRLYNIKKPALVLNTPPFIKIEKKNIFREQLNIGEDKNIFLYQGGLARGRGIEILLETFKELSKDNSKNVIIFMGYGILEDKIKEYSKKYSNIFYYKAVSPEVLLDFTSSADFGISLIEDKCLSYRYCLPNKMFEYLMVDIPVIVSNLPEMAKIIEKYSVGVIAKEYSIKGIKEAVNSIIDLDRDKLNKNIQKVKEIYNWQEQEEIFLKVYNEL